MISASRMRGSIAMTLALALAACGSSTSSDGRVNAPPQSGGEALFHSGPGTKPRGTLGDLFANSGNPNTNVRVNKYIWNAALDVLDFLPIQSVDPFTGVIVTGYGTPPGGGRAYRATIYIQDPALDARSLNLAMETRGGAPVSAETVREIEDAILTRARQLRIADSRL